MKKYRLLKDLPTANAGDVFVLDNDGHLRRDTDCTDIFYSRKELEKYSILKDESLFKEIKTNKNRWLPEYGEKFYKIDSDEIVSGTSAGGEYVNDMRAIGNLFQTEEKAKRYLEYLRCREEILADAKDKDATTSAIVAEIDSYKYGVVFDFFTNDLETVVLSASVVFPLYFKTREDANQSLINNESAWRFLAEYDFMENF